MNSNKKIITFLSLFSAIFILAGCAGGGTLPASYPGMLVNQEVVFLAYNNHVHALDLNNGQEIWKFPREAQNPVSFYAHPVLTNEGQLIVGGYDHVLYGLNPQNGEQIWTFKEAKNRYIATPLVYEDGRIFAANADGVLYAVQIVDGSTVKLLWKFTTEMPLWATPTTDPQCNCIYLTGMDHHVYSIDAQTGNLNWKTEDLEGAMIGMPVYGPNRLLYLGTFNKEMLALDATSGDIRWRYSTQGWIWSSPALVDGKLFFGDLAGYFYALDADKGTLVWSEPLQADGPIAGTPLISDQQIYFTTRNGSIFTVDFNGKSTSKNINETLYTPPILASDIILIATTNNKRILIANDLNLNEQWVFPRPEEQ